MTDRLALHFLAPYRVDIRREALPRPGIKQILVQTEMTAVSAGTEMLVYRGQMPSDLSVDETLPALEGAFDYPLKYGYAAVGKVIDQGDGLADDWRGRRVFAFNPHESHFVIDAADVVWLPEGLPPEAAVMLPSMETAVSLVMDGRPLIGEQVAVLGQGVVGLLTTGVLAQLPLAKLVVLDPVKTRRGWSREFGAHEIYDPDVPGALTDVQNLFEETYGYRGTDLTFELSGSPRALSQAIALTGYNGRLIIGSWYGSKKVELDLGRRFHRSHMQLISSQVSRIGPGLSGRWSKTRRLNVALEQLQSLRPQRLVTHRIPIAEAARAYEMLDRSPAEALQVVLTYNN